MWGAFIGAVEKLPNSFFKVLTCELAKWRITCSF